MNTDMTPESLPFVHRFAAAAITPYLAATSLAHAAAPLPPFLQALKKQGLTIVGAFPSPGSLTACSAYMGRAPAVMYVTPNGKHVIAGTLFDADGRNLSVGRCGKAQLRHAIVGILTPTSAGKAATLLRAYGLQAPRSWRGVTTRRGADARRSPTAILGRSSCRAEGQPGSTGSEPRSRKPGGAGRRHGMSLATQR